MISRRIALTLIGACALLLTLGMTGSASAQTTVRVTSIRAVHNAPQALARVQIGCNDETAYAISPTQLSLIDNGVPVTTCEITSSPSTTTRHPVAIMLALDVSGSMVGSGLAGLQQAANTLVNFMDTTTDEMGIVSFNSVPTLQQDFTANATMLRTTINGLTAAGATAIYDAAWMALQQMIARNDTIAESLILMTDGGDNSSQHSPGDVIALAQQYNKKVFTVGLGSSLQAAILQELADSTGALSFLTPDASELAQIFSEIANFMRRGYDEYTLRYDVPDPTALRHTLQVTASGVIPCAGSASGIASRPVQAGTTAIEDMKRASAAVFELESISPQPVHSGLAQIRVNVRDARGIHLRAELFDQLGRATGISAALDARAGTHILPLDVHALSAGAYHLRVTAGTQVRSLPLLIGR